MSAVLSLWAMLSRLFGQSARPAVLDAASLEKWVETLLPEDAFSPGAGALQVHQDLLEEAASDQRFYQLLAGGIQWMDTRAKALAGVPFVALRSEQAEQIVAEAEAASAQALPHVFFKQTFRLAKRAYYTNPASWAGLGIERPPQPMGYIHHTEAPDG